jgi:hypothetical protein
MVAQWFEYMFRRGKAVLLNGVATQHEHGELHWRFPEASRPDWERKERVRLLLPLGPCIVIQPSLKSELASILPFIAEFRSVDYRIVKFVRSLQAGFLTQ